MLRMSFMPSDFHPLLLVLGNHSDLNRFATLLGEFGRTGAPCRLAEDGGVFSTDTEVALVQAGGAGAERLGLWRDEGGDGLLRWTLTPDDAAAFSAEVEDLAASGAPAGSVTLECEILNEIKVKVSIGEWEDHFLSDEVR